MTANTIRTVDGVEIYPGRIFELVDEYALNLPDGRSLDEAETFTGLIGYLYANLFKPAERGKHGSNLDYDDLESLDTVWMTYAQLCGRYKQTPSLFEYCSLTGISPDTLTDWQSGRLRGNDVERVRTIKRWKNQSVAGLEKKAVNSNSVGAIFTLKAAHMWRETAPVTETYDQIASHDTPEQIAARHSAARLPEPIDLDGMEG